MLIVCTVCLVMLKGLVKMNVMALIHSNELVQQDEVEECPERISDAVLDESVDIHIIRKYFSYAAWQKVTEMIKQKRALHVFFCQTCHQNADEHPSICCDTCLCWYHLHCVALKSQPKTKNWFCRSCMVVHKEKNDEDKGWEICLFYPSPCIFHCYVV